MGVVRRVLALAFCALAFAPAGASMGTLSSTTLPAAAGDSVAASNQTAWIANSSLDRVAVIGQSLDATYIPVGRTPRYIVATSRGFLTSNVGDNTVSVQSSATTAATAPVGGAGPIALNFIAGIAYVLRPDGVVIRVDVATLTSSSFDTGLRAPTGHALNQAGNRLYVADASGEVRVFDVTAASPAQAMESFHVPGRPVAIASGADPKLYVLTDAQGGTLVEIDLGSNGIRTYALPGAQGPRTLLGGGLVIAGFANALFFFDSVTHNLTSVPADDIRALDADGQSGLAFAVGGSRFYAIDTRTLEVASTPIAPNSSGVKFLYKPCTAYVAGPVTTLVRVPCGDLGVAGIRAHALWWVAEGAESGWGMNIAHHGQIGKLFATWFTYDANGQPTWLVMSDGSDTGRNSYQGALYRTTGPAFSAATFDPSKVTRTAVGSMSVSVFSVNSLAINATVDGASIKKNLARQIFSSPVPYCEAGLAPGGALPVYQDLWWNPNESGWGLNIAHQGNILFITWFTYDTDGKPVWFVGSDIEKTGNATYSGTLYKTFGPPITASPWDPARVTRMPIGSATLTFNDPDNGTFAYTVSGISGSKAITRQVFATPMTRCR